MDLQKLRGFYWTAHFGTVSGAATKMHISQSAVSHQLKALEVELDAKLYERTRRGIALTPEGERLLDYARTVIHSLSDLRNEFDDLRDEPRGTVRLAAFRGITIFSLPDIIQRYHAQHPNVRLVVSSKIQDGTILQLTSTGEVDLGITTSWNTFDGLEYREFASYEMYACMSRDHPWAERRDPLTLHDLAEHPLLLYERGTAIRSRIDRHFARQALHPEVSIEAGGANAILEYVQRGMGVGIISGLVLDEYQVPGMHKIPVTDLFGRLGYGFVLRSGRYLPAAIRAFLAIAGAGGEPAIGRAT